VACCVVVEDAFARPSCAVNARFAALDKATLMLLCAMGPSFPGLLMRTITTTLTGCCCVAVAVEPAL
jgi:hypothetical protein